MKKFLALILSATLLMGLFAGCGNSASTPSDTSSAPAPEADADNQIKIVTTIFPEYDWVRQVLGDQADNVDLTLLLKNGVDLHSYQPTADDLVAISEADLFIYVGGPSDFWVQDALDNATNKDMVVVNLFDVLGDAVKPMPVVEGMEPHHHDHEEEGEHCDVGDEHVWLSLPRAVTAVNAIADALGKIDADHASLYSDNAAAYVEKLNALDGDYKAAVAEAPLDTIVFADRFPFFYLADDYQLHYYAAFTGCSAESDASFETVAFLAKKIDEIGTHSVLTIENCSHDIPQTVIDNTKAKDQKVLVMDSLHSVTSDNIEDGLTYLDVMTDNLDVLRQALQ